MIDTTSKTKKKKNTHTHTQYPCAHYSWNVTQNTHVLIIHEMFHPFPLKDNFFFKKVSTYDVHSWW